MGIIAWGLCLIALIERRANRKIARYCMSFAISIQCVGIIGMIIASTTRPQIMSRQAPLIAVVEIVILGLMIVARVKLNRDLSEISKKPAHFNKKAGTTRARNSSSLIDYVALADELFDVSLELTNHSGNHIASKGAFRFSPSTIQSATLYGTGLYEYSVLLLRERMKKIYTNKAEFEAEDNKMIEVFAKKIQIPVPAFLKIVDRNGGVKKWESALLQEKELPMREYMDEVRVLVNKATRGLEPIASSKSESAEDFEGYDDEDDFDDGL